MHQTAPGWLFDERYPERVRSICFELFLLESEEKKVCLDRTNFLFGCWVASIVGLLTLFEGVGNLPESTFGALAFSVSGFVLVFFETKKANAKSKYRVELDQRLRKLGYRYYSGVDRGDKIEKLNK